MAHEQTNGEQYAAILSTSSATIVENMERRK